MEQLQEANRVSSRWRSKCISQEEQSATKISALEGTVKSLQDAAGASEESKKRELAHVRQQLEASFNSQQLALHSKLSDNQHALRQLESECSASKARIKELEASCAKLRVRKATEEERLNEDIRRLRLNAKTLQEQLSLANSKSESLLHSGEMQLRQHDDEKSGILAENAALREQLQKMMSMRSSLPGQFGSQWPSAAPELQQTAQQSHSNESASFAHGTPSYSRRDMGANTFPASSASQVSHSPWTHPSSAAAHAHSSSAAHVPSAAQHSSMFTPSAAASAVATPLWPHAGSRGGHALGMSFASQMEATGGAGRQDESSELLKQQCVLHVALWFWSRAALTPPSDTPLWCRRPTA